MIRRSEIPGRAIARLVVSKSGIAQVLADLAWVVELLALRDVQHQEPQHRSQREVTQDPEILRFPQVKMVQQLWLELSSQPHWAWVVREQVQPLPVLVLEQLQRV